MKQRLISKDISASFNNNPSAGYLDLTVKVTTKALLMAPWFFSIFLFYPETRFILPILAAVASIAVVIRTRFRGYREEDELVAYKDRDDIVVYKKSANVKKFTFTMSTVKRAWIHQDYTIGALTSSFLFFLFPCTGKKPPTGASSMTWTLKRKSFLPCRGCIRMRRLSTTSIFSC